MKPYFQFSRTTFRRQLTVYAALAVILMALATALSSSWLSSTQIRQTLVLQGERVAESLAEQSRLALLSGSADNAAGAITATLAFPDVIAVELLDANGKRISINSKGASTWPVTKFDRQVGRTDLSSWMEAEDDEAWSFQAIVRIKAEEESPFAADEAGKAQVLGSVRVLQGKDTLWRLRKDVFVTNLVLSLFFALLFLSVLAWLTRRLTNPLTALSSSMALAEQGAPGVRAVPHGPRDISDMARAFNSMMEVLEAREKELVTARDDAMELARIKSQFAATVSHEIRTPLNGVVGTLDMLINSDLSARQRHFAELAWDSSQYLLDLVNNILDFSRLESGTAVVDAQALDLLRLAEGVVDSLAPQAMQKGLEIGYSIAPGLPERLMADERKLRQVLTNLVGNAVKFCDSGEIAIRFFRLGEGGSVSGLRCEVSDSGPGIPAGMEEQIFESFVQGDASPTRRHEGSGLGLTITRKLVTVMQGTIAAESLPEGGARFWFEIPLVPAIGEFETDVPTGMGLNVLVVDPSPIARDFFATTLSRLGHTCLCADGFASAIALHHGWADDAVHDVVLVDVSLLASAGGEASAEFSELQKIPASANAGWGMMTPFVDRTAEPSAPFRFVLGKPLRARRVTEALLAAMLPPGVNENKNEARSAEAGAFRVLVVEDNRTNQTVVCSMIHMLGGVSGVAPNGSAAVSAWERGNWDVILMDCHMPDVDGYEATALIRLREGQSGARAPIVAMTANVRNADIEKCLAAGMDDHLAKPFTLEDLRAKLERWLPPYLATHLRGTHNVVLVNSPESDGSNGRPLDPFIIARLHDALGSAMGEAIQPFLEDMPVHLVAMRDAVSARNAGALRNAAHVVKGAAGNLGAMPLAAAARSLQECAEAGDFSAAGEAVEHIHTEYTRAADALQEVLADFTEPASVANTDGAVVLVVDDDRSTRSALRYALQLNGFQIHEAANGPTALRLIERFTPDVVLMDAVMPELDGFTTCARMKELPQGRELPILMITALDDRQSIERAYAAGASDYITKPLHLHVVVQRVRRTVEASRSERHVRHLAYNDGLTGLPNRTLVSDILQQQIERARHNSSTVAVLFLDLDRFKFVNDSLGHEIGDHLLKAVARRLKQCVRAGDCVARLGGDEFTVVLDDLANGAAAAAAAQKIALALAEPFSVRGQDIFVSTSIGISLFPYDGEDVSTLLRHADTAMYKAKRGNLGYRFYDSGMEVGLSDHLKMEGDLRRALERNELALHYQPEVDCATGELFGAEALLRWRHPVRGMVSPADFITLAEETGLIVPIGDWVLRTACEQMRQWVKATGADIRISINLSGGQLQSGDFATRVEEVLRETQLDPRHVIFEITESVWMEQASAALSTLHRLKNIGIKLAIDDFGTGYSSLSYLKRLPVDILKIDRSFIEDLVEDTADRAIVEGIMALARSLRLEVVAEGVETIAQREVLREIGCDYLQGYLLSRPLDPVDFGRNELSLGPALKPGRASA